MIILLVIVGIIAAAFGLNRFFKEDCPKLYLGYSRCNRWRGEECDHSKETWRRVKEGMKR